MRYMSFIDLYKDVSDLYEKKQFSDALALLEKGMSILSQEEYQEHLFLLLLNKAYIYINIEMYDKCLDTLSEMIELGFVSPMHSRFLEPVKNNERFLKLKEKNDILLARVQEKAKLDYKVFLPEDYREDKKYPLIMVLHGDGADGNIKDISSNWKPDVFLERGFIIVYPQSSQILCHNGYGWIRDPLKARRELRECYDMIVQRYSVDTDCVIISGFSGGAITSVDIAMADVFSLKGFIALCPEIKPQSVTKEAAEAAVKRGIRGIFMEGENMMPMADEEEMASIFKEAGMPFQYYVNKGTGHWYPEDLDEKLVDALRFILGE